MVYVRFDQSVSRVFPSSFRASGLIAAFAFLICLFAAQNAQAQLTLTVTPATVSIGGRVMTASERGITNVRLTLTDSNGQVRTRATTSFGYYRFDDVQVGETYILSAIDKHYTFSQPLQVLNINGETDAVNFIANSEKRIRSF